MLLQRMDILNVTDSFVPQLEVAVTKYVKLCGADYD